MSKSCVIPIGKSFIISTMKDSFLGMYYLIADKNYADMYLTAPAFAHVVSEMKEYILDQKLGVLFFMDKLIRLRIDNSLEDTDEFIYLFKIVCEGKTMEYGYCG